MVDSPEIPSKRRRLNDLPKLFELVNPKRFSDVAVKFVEQSVEQEEAGKQGSRVEQNKQELSDEQNEKLQQWLSVYSEDTEERDLSLSTDPDEPSTAKGPLAGDSSAVETVKCPQCLPSFEKALPELVPRDQITYADLTAGANIVSGILEAHGVRQGFVGVALKQGVLLPPALLGVMKSGCGFYPLDYNQPFTDSDSSRKILGLNWVITDQSYCDSSGVTPFVKSLHRVEVPVVGAYFFLVLLSDREGETSSPCEPVSPFKYAYAIRTSGTTGNRRIVLVPHQAIVVNVLDFVKKFKVRPKDTILGIAPITFDPSIIDLFISLAAGARILYVSPQVKLVPSKLAQVSRRENVTIMQCTPSFIQRFDKKILQAELLSSGSSLRILALGGEKCLSKQFIRDIYEKDPRRTIKFYNLYGTTEVSCWASLEEICLDNGEEISLGKPLSFTKFGYLPLDKKEEGEILIGFRRQRQCKVISEKYGTEIQPFHLDEAKAYSYFQTGDLVRKSETSPGTVQYFFVNRMDRIRKRNGVKVDLEAIEKVALDSNLFKSSICLNWHEAIVLVLSFEGSKESLEDVSSDLHRLLKQNLFFDYHPDRIIFVPNEIPLTENGKPDLQKIMNQQTEQTFRKSFRVNYSEFLEIFTTLWNFNTRSSKEGSSGSSSDDDLFLSSGGNSLSANRFVEEFFDKIQQFGSAAHVKNEKALKEVLLSKCFKEVKSSFWKVVETQTEYHCVYSLVEQELGPSSRPPAASKENEILKKSGVSSFDSKLALSIPPCCVDHVSIHIGMCVDAIPVITSHPTDDEICVIGSHSGTLYAFRLSSMFDQDRSDPNHSVVWKKTFPGRIETAPAIHRIYYYAYLSCHDGKLYKISTIDGELEWSFTCPTEIRASPCLTQDGSSVLFNTHDTIYCLDSNSGTIQWKLAPDCYVLQTSSIVTSESNAFFTTINGIISVSLRDGSIVWRSSHSQVRTCPLIVPFGGEKEEEEEEDDDDEDDDDDADRRVAIVFGDTVGRIFAINEVDGSEIWTSQIHDSPPNHPVFHECDESSLEENRIVYTTHDGSLICLTPETGKENGIFINAFGSTRSLPAVIDVIDESEGEEEIQCCCFCNSLDGELFFKALSTNDLDPIKVFSQDDEESFSSVVFSSKYRILAIGARDNCIHFLKIN